MSEDGRDTSKQRKSALVQGEYFSTPLPVYSSDSSDSYETDDETDAAPSALPLFGRISGVAAKRSKRAREDSGLPAGYEYETDSEEEDSSSAPSSAPSHPKQKVMPSETKKTPHDPIAWNTHDSVESLEYETDSEAATELDIVKQQARAAMVVPFEDSFNNDRTSSHSFESGDYETDSEDASQSKQQAQAVVLSFEDLSKKRKPLEPDAKEDEPSQPQESSSPIRRLSRELDVAKEHMQKWKASSLTITQKRQEKDSEETAQEDLWLRLNQLESIGQLGNQIAELQQLLEQERAEHEQTKYQANWNSFSHSEASSVSQKSMKARDSIIDNALASTTESGKMAALEQVIREAREVITILDQEMTNLDTSSRSIIQEKDVQIETLQTKNQELLESQNASSQTNESPMKDKDAQFEALQIRVQELLESQNALRQKNESMDALLTRKEALLQRKAEEIASLKEVIRNKDLTLQSYITASLEEIKDSRETVGLTTDTKDTSSSMSLVASKASPSEQEGNHSEPQSDSIDKVSESVHQASMHSAVDQKPSVMEPKTETISSPSPTATTTGDNNNDGQTQMQLGYDLDRELDSLRIKVHEMMNETIMLTDLVDQKDVELRYARRQVKMLQAENTKFKESIGAMSIVQNDIDTSMDQVELSKDTLQAKLQNAQQSIAANKLTIASLQAELEVEKLRCEELEQQLAKDDSSVSISDVESLETNSRGTAATGAAIIGAKKKKKKSQSLSKDKSTETVPQEEGHDGKSSFGAIGIRVFGQEAKLDAELDKKEGASGLQVGNEETQPSSSQRDEDMENLRDKNSEEISRLNHLIRKREEGIGVLRDKIEEQESLISLLNKTLSGKDSKIDRLERLIHGQSSISGSRNANDVIHHHSISKVLEENEMTMDSLVLYRLETEQQLATFRRQIRELEDQLRGSKETEYQLRRRTEDLSSAESHVRRLKAELKSESHHRSQLVEEHREQLGRVTEEKMRLEYTVDRQSQELQEKLREREDFINSIHSEATEKGLLIDSLETSLKESNRRMEEMESKITHQNSKITVLTSKLDQQNEEQMRWIEEKHDKDELIQMLNESRLEGQRIISELAQQQQQQKLFRKNETSRQKRLRRHLEQKGDRISGLDAYMEPFVLDLHQAEVQYNKARKNLRLAQARERLIRPASARGEE